MSEKAVRRVTILGSTGSIGVNALDVLRHLNGRNGARPRFRVQGLSVQKNVELLKKQILEFRPASAAVYDAASAEHLRAWAKSRRLAIRIGAGAEGLEGLAADPRADLVVSAVVGAVGVGPLLAAVKAGKKVALANKEALIVAGDVVTREAKRSGAELIPVDSEHSAIFQCLAASPRAPVRRIILTASGGAFYRRQDSLHKVSVSEALAHPTWKMGNKITIDCATLMNKGLEAIEAHHLFNVPMERIHIVIHPQSIVHSLVEFEDGSILAQLSHPDMRLPIQYALTYPDRLPTAVRPLHLEEIRKLEFDTPDFRRFPCLDLALTAGRKGGTWPAVLNGANEVAVQAFLEEKLSFVQIPDLIRRVVRRHRPASAEARGIREILAADQWARQAARSLLS